MHGAGSPGGVECRRDFRIALRGQVEVQVDNQWRDLTLADICLTERGLAATSVWFRPVPYARECAIRTASGDAERWYVPTSSDKPFCLRFRYLFDTAEDPIQAFVGAP
jgi:hypothetical protein